MCNLKKSPATLSSEGEVHLMTFFFHNATSISGHLRFLVPQSESCKTVPMLFSLCPCLIFRYDMWILFQKFMSRHKAKHQVALSSWIYKQKKRRHPYFNLFSLYWILIFYDIRFATYVYCYLSKNRLVHFCLSCNGFV